MKEAIFYTLGNFMLYVVFVALLAAFVLALMRKVGVIEYVQVHGNAFFSEMFNCNFCLSWWTGLFVSIVAFMFIGDPALFAVPFCSTMITRFIL